MHDDQAVTDANIASVMAGTVMETRPPEQIGPSELRMWLFVRKDLPMPMGKFGPQAGHAYGTCLWLTGLKDSALASAYISQAQGKISVGVKDEAELLASVEACRAAGLVAVAVKDAAHTVFPEPVFTVGAVGPCYRDQLPKKVARLRLFEKYAMPEVETNP